MEEHPRSAPTHRAEPLTAGVAAWVFIAIGFAYLFVPDRPGAAFGTWDAALQIVALFLLFSVLPLAAVHGIDLYRAHVVETPEREPRHRLGLALILAAGTFAVGAWTYFAWTAGAGA